MLNKLKSKILKNPEILALSGLIIITIISTSYYNYSKNKIYNHYKQTINNVYLKKTVDHILNNLEPKFKKIQHRVTPGETFESILENYSIKNEDIFKMATDSHKEYTDNSDEERYRLYKLFVKDYIKDLIKYILHDFLKVDIGKLDNGDTGSLFNDYITNEN